MFETEDRAEFDQIDWDGNSWLKRMVRTRSIERLLKLYMLYLFLCLLKPRTRNGANIHIDVLDLYTGLCSQFVEKFSIVTSRMKRKKGLIAFN